MELINQLNQHTGDVWQDIVLDHPAYDPDTTEELDPSGANDRFALVDGTVVAFDAATRQWHVEESPRHQVVQEYFGAPEEERGPGRPEVGPAIQVRVPEEMLARLDAHAAQEGISRAEAVRRLLARSLAAGAELALTA